MLQRLSCLLSAPMLLLRNRAGSTGPPRRRGKVLRLQADSVLLSPVVPRPYRLRVSAAHGRLHFLRPTSNAIVGRQLVAP